MKIIKIKTLQKLFITTGVLVLTAFALAALPAQSVYAVPPTTPSVAPTDTTATGATDTTPSFGTCGPQKNQICSGDTTDPAAIHVCGSDGNVGNVTPGEDHHNEVKVGFDFGCRGDAYPGQLNPILDIAFAILRFLSTGVGLIVIGSIIVAGIQYSASRGNPQATEAAIKRITSSLIGLLIFIFMFAFLNFIIPGGMFI